MKFKKGGAFHSHPFSPPRPMISIQGAPVPAPTGISVAELDSAIAHAVGTKDTVLGIRQGDDVYPLQVVAATPGSFGTGDFKQSLQERVERTGAAPVTALPNQPLRSCWNSRGVKPLRILIVTWRKSIHSVTHTGIYGLDPHDIYDAVLIVTAGEHSMTFSQYQSYVRTLIGKPDSEKNFVVTRLLFGLFHAIDINSTGVVSTDDLTAVLVVS